MRIGDCPGPDAPPPQWSPGPRVEEERTMKPLSMWARRLFRRYPLPFLPELLEPDQPCPDCGADGALAFLGTYLNLTPLSATRFARVKLVLLACPVCDALVLEGTEPLGLVTSARAWLLSRGEAAGLAK